MLRYNYKCVHCPHVFNPITVSVPHGAQMTCPSCGNPRKCLGYKEKVEGTFVHYGLWALFLCRVWPKWFWRNIPKRFKKDPLANIGRREILPDKIDFYSYDKSKIRL